MHVHPHLASSAIHSGQVSRHVVLGGRPCFSILYIGTLRVPPTSFVSVQQSFLTALWPSTFSWRSEVQLRPPFLASRPTIVLRVSALRTADPALFQQQLFFQVLVITNAQQHAPFALTRNLFLLRVEFRTMLSLSHHLCKTSPFQETALSTLMNASMHLQYKVPVIRKVLASRHQG